MFYIVSTVLLPAPVSSHLLPVLLLVLGTAFPAAAATLSTGSQEDQEEEGGDEDAEPEDAEHRHILQTYVMVIVLLSEIFTTKPLCLSTVRI